MTTYSIPSRTTSVPVSTRAQATVQPSGVTNQSGAPLLSRADVERAAGPSGASWLPPMDGGISPEEVLAACRHRVQSLDGQIREIMGEMSRRNRIQGIMSEISRLAGQTVNGGETTELRSDAEAAIRELLGELEACGPDGAAAARAITDTLNEGADGDGVRHIEITALTEAVSNGMASINAGTEMLQLRLQTLLNQRQQAVTLTSNMIASFHQLDMAITQNIRS